RRLESRRRAGQTGASSTSARMHSQRQGVLKRQLIKSSFSRDAKNCLTRYVRSYSAGSACDPRGRPIRAEAWGIVLDRSAMRVKLRDNSRHRNASSAAFTTPIKLQSGLARPRPNTMLTRDHLRHHGDQDWTPCRKQDIANRIGYRVAKGGEFALRLFLDGAKRGRDRPCSGTSTQDDNWVHLQYISAEEDRHGVGQNRDNKADQDETEA